ncbi:MAG: M67 family metallopeptidase [Magnetococcales bacterium]|nr:M67 family metallopeptidase [Magnetococcales bacterium]
MDGVWKIPRPLVNRILGHAQRCAPRESVALLCGRPGELTEWHPLPNISGREDRYLADPQAQIALMRQFRQEGKQVVAICHSHPNSPAEPSPTDLTEDNHPGLLHLICSLNTQGCLDLRGFLYQDGTFHAQELVLHDET